MGFAERRKVLGYSQEGLAHALGVDRTTVGRWESGKTVPQPPLRRKLAEALQLDLAELDALVPQPRANSQESAGPPPSDRPGPGDIDEMIRREFLRVLAITGALAALPADETAALAAGVHRGTSADFMRMNDHLWQVYQLARAKGSVYPIVRDQLTALNKSLDGRADAEAQALCNAAGDLFQLAGELAFDSNRYTDAAASYALAASASKDSGSFDLWACALVRLAYVDLHEDRYREAAAVLSVAERVAKRGDSSLATRHWVASVQAEAHAGLGEFTACERALDEAAKVLDLGGLAHNSGWLRFDGSRLAEERGARYVQLGRLDLAEAALTTALSQGPLAQGQSLRRRGAVLTDLAAVGAKRHDLEQVLTYGCEALHLARESCSGYVARRLQSLRTEFGPIAGDHRIAELDAEISGLTTT
ncbi:helix-turn-helix transcriptional regulator [Streptomyces sp. NBC_01481]|uniref:helix-turn-helix transcriptional regulator n=1 Tax=Streptomyces sp. NBC_01481 TaxID=2975869 RepID=UPI00225BB7A4|nr:helix-turn-helix transcriptional regulator [Streptomyces sp. NBC_01481]MCX4582678.1 helix-turn-helix domain-containing protein [Streptomyces sp. NBC_01481]